MELLNIWPFAVRREGGASLDRWGTTVLLTVCTLREVTCLVGTVLFIHV